MSVLFVIALIAYVVFHSIKKLKVKRLKCKKTTHLLYLRNLSPTLGGQAGNKEQDRQTNRALSSRRKP